RVTSTPAGSVAAGGRPDLGRERRPGQPDHQYQADEDPAQRGEYLVERDLQTLLGDHAVDDAAANLRIAVTQLLHRGLADRAVRRDVLGQLFVVADRASGPHQGGDRGGEAAAERAQERRQARAG